MAVAIPRRARSRTTATTAAASAAASASTASTVGRSALTRASCHVSPLRRVRRLAGGGGGRTGGGMDGVDVALVGAGPAGLFGAYYAGFRGLSVMIIDALPEPGGQVTALYPEKMIFDVAGFPAIRGRDLIANLVEQADQFHPRYRLGVRADEIDYDDGRPVLRLSDGERVRCG